MSTKPNAQAVAAPAGEAGELPHVFIHFNAPHWPDVRAQTEDLVHAFLRANPQGGWVPLTLEFFVEDPVHMDRQTDHVGGASRFGIGPSARLSMHLEASAFGQTSPAQQLAYSANAVLHLLRHWQAHLPQPKPSKHSKGFDLDACIADFAQHLQTQGLLLAPEQTQAVFIKPAHCFRVDFECHRMQDLRESQWLFDRRDFTQYINDRIHPQNYGSAVTALLVSWDVFDFDGPQAAALRADPLKPMRTRDKTLCIAQQFDSNAFVHNADYLPQDAQGQLRHWQAGLLAALDRVAAPIWRG